MGIKKGFLAGSLVAIVFLIGSWTVLGYGQEHQSITSLWHELGERFKLSNAPENKNRVIARINGEEATLAEFLDRKAILQAKAKSEGKDESQVSNRDAFNLVVSFKVQVAEAKRRGINVTEEEVDRLIQQQRTNATNSSVVKVDPDALPAFLKGLGISEEEYWGKYLRSKYRDSLYLIKLRQIIYNQLPGGSIQDQYKAYDAFVNQLLNNARIEILDHSLGL
ncbi:MAG: SurA N-terminal domain-containing protein [Candidatus Methanomethyliaceae archaeon]